MLLFIDLQGRYLCAMPTTADPIRPKGPNSPSTAITNSGPVNSAASLVYLLGVDGQCAGWISAGEPRG